jgi:hypothetical protein
MRAPRKARHRPLNAALALAAVAAALTPAAVRADLFTQKLVRRIDGANHFEELGLTVVRSAGDLTGDGVPDIIAGLRTVPLPGNQVSARVYSGADLTLLHSIPRPAHPDWSPNPVAGLDDLDGDGRPEFIVGTPAAGVVRVYSSDGSLLGTLARPPSTKFGASVSRAGDTNLDGVQDILIGAPGESAVHVHSGDALLPTPFPLIAVITGPERTRFGASVAHFDGPPPAGGTRRLPSRIVVGAPLEASAGGGGHNGCVHVFVLDATPGGMAIPLFSSFGQGSFDLLGADVDGGVDVDGDSFEDYLASAIAADLPVPQGSGQIGRGYVTVFSGANGQALRTFQSDQIGDLYGFSVRFGGPCGDEPTVIIGAPQAVRQDLGGTTKVTGRVLVHSLGIDTPLAEIHGESKFAGMGIGVGGYADVTGDGRAEFLAGSHGAHSSTPPGLFGSGSVYVLSCVDIPRPAIAAAPAPLLFDSTQVGGTVDAALTIFNVGPADLHVAAPSFGPATSSAFSFSGPAGAMTIAPGDSKALPMRFMPATPGVHGGLLRIPSDDPCTPVLTIGLGGKALLKKILVDPPAVAFGPVEVGGGTGAVMAVKNDGNLPLTVSGVSLAAGDFGIAFLPGFPKTLAPGGAFLFVAFFQPSVQGTAGASIQVSSDDPANPTVGVPLSGTGTLPNPAPTAVIEMDVPYARADGSVIIPFRGDQSFDTPPFPPAQVLQFFWAFAGLGSSTSMNQVFGFPCSPGSPCIEVTRLTVTDSGSKSDPTSVSVISLGERPVRSRFYGRIQRGGFDVQDGTVVEAWINDVKVASALTQTHHRKSVYAIEVPPNLGGPGGMEQDTVEFRYRNATANETGTWYSATDQELDLTAPIYIPPLLLVPWCVTVQSSDICGPSLIVPDPGLHIIFQPRPGPFPDPGPLRFVSQPFTLEFFGGVGGSPITRFSEDYQIVIRYSDREIEAQGITNEGTLSLHVLEGEGWVRAGSSLVDADGNEIVTSLDHASTFALLGEGSTSEGRRKPGDCTQDGEVNISDPICLLNFLFLGTPVRLPCGDGSTADPANLALMDWNGDGQINLTDAIAGLLYLFSGGRSHSGGEECIEIADCTERCA